MSILSQLRSLLAESTVEEGKILSSNGSTFTVATKRGSLVVERQIGDATNYKLGDAVKLKSSFLTGRVPSAANSVKYPLN